MGTGALTINVEPESESVGEGGEAVASVSELVSHLRRERHLL